MRRRPSTTEERSIPKSRTEFATIAPTPLLVFSIRVFCEVHDISEGFYYKLRKQGEGPREMKVGARTLITLESAAEWRRTQENRVRQRLPSLPDPENENPAAQTSGGIKVRVGPKKMALPHRRLHEDQHPKPEVRPQLPRTKER